MPLLRRVAIRYTGAQHHPLLAPSIFTQASHAKDCASSRPHRTAKENIFGWVPLTGISRVRFRMVNVLIQAVTRRGIGPYGSAWSSKFLPFQSFAACNKPDAIAGCMHSCTVVGRRST